MPAGGLLTIPEAAQRLRRGEILAYPTEAVYGLGCDPSQESAVRGILRLKSRPAAAGLILIGSSLEQLRMFMEPVSDALLQRAGSTWPGPVTWLFPRAAGVPDWLAGSHDTVALRLTAHPVCRALCTAFGGAIVSTSANPRGLEPARSVADVQTYFGDSIGGIVEGGLGSGEQPSEIRDLASGRVIRAGRSEAVSDDPQ